MQVVARANEAGLRLVPRHLFQYQTIKALAVVADMAECRPVVGLGHVPLASETATESYELAGLDESVFQKVSALLERIDASEGRPA